MKKRALSLALALVMCLGLMPGAVFADEADGDTPDTSVTDPVETPDQEPEPEPETPSNPDFDIKNGVLKKYNGSGGNVTIPDGVTSIGDKAFDGCENLTQVTIPSSVTSIGGGAFSGTGLTSVTIPNSVTSIGRSAFSYSRDLTSVTISSSVTSIEEFMFYDCGGLTQVTIPSSVTSIGKYAFSGCLRLTQVTIPNSVTSIGYNAFNGTGLTSVTIPDSVTSIDQAFIDCRHLASVTIPHSTETPDRHGSIGNYMFNFCPKLKDVYFGGTKAQWEQWDGMSLAVMKQDHLIVHCSDGDLNLGVSTPTTPQNPETVTVQVSFNTNGGSSVSDKTVTVGERYGSLSSPTREGYTFDGWYTSSTGGSRVTSSTTVSNESNHTLYAHWTEAGKKVTVSFDSNGGSSVSSKTVTTGQTYGDLSTPTREGYTFDGWYTAKTGGSKVTSSTTVTDTYDHTLYARWKEVSVTPLKPETAMPTNDKLTVDGVLANPTVYKIDGGNYFKIRDVAALLNGTEKQFSVGYDGKLKSVTATTGEGYTKLDTDLLGAPAGGNKTADPSNDTIYVNGVKIDAEVYKIDGGNYFKLRDLGKALNFSVDWTREAGVMIDTSKPYTE